MGGTLEATPNTASSRKHKAAGSRGRRGRLGRRLSHPHPGATSGTFVSGAERTLQGVCPLERLEAGRPEGDSWAARDREGVTRSLGTGGRVSRGGGSQEGNTGVRRFGVLAAGPVRGPATPPAPAAPGRPHQCVEWKGVRGKPHVSGPRAPEGEFARQGFCHAAWALPPAEGAGGAGGRLPAAPGPAQRAVGSRL